MLIRLVLILIVIMVEVLILTVVYSDSGGGVGVVMLLVVVVGQHQASRERSPRLFIVASRPNERYPDAPQMAPVVMINPKILSASNELIAGDEGCLSVPGKRVSILRHQWLEVSWQNLSGEHNTARLEGFVARIFQHELDHLDGITLLERMANQTREQVPS